MWIAFALISAATQALRNTLMKEMGQRLNEYITVWSRFTFLLPWAAIAILLQEHRPLPIDFWLASIATGITISASTTYLTKALKQTDISLVIPLWKTFQIFTLSILGLIFLREQISLQGGIGIFVMMIGVYMINIDGSDSFIEPLQKLWKTRALLDTVYAGVLLGIAAAFFKHTIVSGGPYNATFWNYAFGSMVMLPITLKRTSLFVVTLRKNILPLAGLGILACITTITGSIAYSLTTSSYVESMKQSEILFTILFGILFFGEWKRVQKVWKGCVVIVIGGIILSSS